MAKKKVEKPKPSAPKPEIPEAKKEERLSFSLKDWDWPFDFPSDLARDAFLDELMGINPLFTDEQRRTLIASLHGSYSLDLGEKKRVIAAYDTLSEFQYTELLKVFKEEVEKFVELGESHPDDIRKLDNKTEIEWAAILAARDGVIRLYTHISKDKLQDKDTLLFVAHLVQSSTAEQSAHAILRICLDCINNMISEKMYEDEEKSKYYRFFVNQSIFISSYIYHFSYDSPLLKRLMKQAESYPSLEDFSPKELFYQSVFMKQGFILFEGKEEEAEFKEAVASIARSYSFAVPYRELVSGETENIVESMMAVLRFNAASKSVFERQIDEKIDNLSFEALADYAKCACDVFVVFYAFTGRNLVFESGEHGADFGRIYSLLKGRLKRTPQGIDLKYAGNFKLLTYLLEGREIKIEGAQIDGDHIWHNVRVIRRGKIDIEGLMDSLKDHRYLQKVDAYKIALYVYATALSQISNPEEWDFKEAQEKAVILFGKIHHKYRIPTSQGELAQFHGYLTPPRRGDIAEMLKRFKEGMTERRSGKEEDD